MVRPPKAFRENNVVQGKTESFTTTDTLQNRLDTWVVALVDERWTNTGLTPESALIRTTSDG